MAYSTEQLGAIRRDFHRYPEPSWCEFLTTSRLVDHLEDLDVDELAVGRQALDLEARMAVPDEATLTEWADRAREAGARADVLEATADGATGVVAVIERGDGPTVGLRVDIDALYVDEADGEDHTPAARGFRSANEGVMHACGHDAHMAVGLGTIAAVQDSDFDGTLIVFFQPAEEVAGGGKAMAETAYCGAVDYLLAVHLGLDHPTGEVVAGIVKPLAMAHLAGEITGTDAHAGKAPNRGDNAIQALGTLIQNAYAIPRHESGSTRVNVGLVEAGTSSNIVADRARFEAEVRGETTALMTSMKDRLDRTVAEAAAMHGCSASLEVVSESPRADSDGPLVGRVEALAEGLPAVESTVRWADFGASEDATFLMNTVAEGGGLASYVVVGTDHPGAHHTATFDVDEASLGIAVDLLAGTVEAIGQDPPKRNDAG